MAVEFKKTLKHLYDPKTKPSIVNIENANYIAVRGSGARNDEGTCVQCMHIGPYDKEPETVAKMHEYIISEGYELDINEMRFHHEIYIFDVRKTAPEKLKTVIRHPIRKKS